MNLRKLSGISKNRIGLSFWMSRRQCRFNSSWSIKISSSKRGLKSIGTVKSCLMEFHMIGNAETMIIAEMKREQTESKKWMSKNRTIMDEKRTVTEAAMSKAR